MPYLSPRLVLEAAESLKGRPPLGVVTIPALLRAGALAGIDVTEAGGIDFSGADETSLLIEFFSLPHPPDVDRSCRAVWDSKGLWVKPDYPSKSLQRRRKDFANAGKLFAQTKVQGAPDRWQLLPDAGETLADDWGGTHGVDNATIRLVDLALWFGREREWDDIDAVLRWFADEFSPDRGDLVGTLYSDDVPDAYRDFPMVDEPIDIETYVALGSLPAAPALDGTLAELVVRLEQDVRATRFVLPDGLVQRVMSAWMRGDLVVLVGQPGTGKTRFATTLGRAMRDALDLDEPLLLPIRADFDEAEFVGYERLDGAPHLREFASRVLRTERPLQPQVVVLEEFNLATIEAYLSGVLSALQESSRSVALPGGDLASLPVDAFIIATCNSFRDEPETRTRISAPTKRRSTIINMPNVLWVEVGRLPQGVDDQAFEGLIVRLMVDLVIAERENVERRVLGDQASTFDAARLEALSTLEAPSDLSAEVRTRLGRLARAVLSTTEGRQWFTLGLLRDLALSLAYAERGNAQAELTCLVTSVADKLLHQLRGPNANLETLMDALDGLPGLAEVLDLAERMKGSGALNDLQPLI